MKAFAFLVFFFLVTEVIAQQAESKEKIKKGDLAFNFSALKESGEQIQLADFEGKYVLLDFTHIGCGPCWQSYPHLSEIQNKYRNELEVITFHIDDNERRWRQMAAARNIEVNWLTLWEIIDKQEQLKKYQIDGFPYYFLINPEGVIADIAFGYRKGKLNGMLRKHIE